MFNCTSTQNRNRMAAMHQRAQAAGTVCLNSAWQGGFHRYSFRCQHGHEWERSAAVQRGNAHCPACGYIRGGLVQRKSENLQELHEIARARGGSCLADEYSGARARYAFVCAAGHRWQTTCDAVLRGAWCRQCVFAAMKVKPKPASVSLHLSLTRRLPDGLQRLQQCARDKGGVCLSETYVPNKARHRFRCAAGHEWESFAGTIFSGGWCSACVVASKRLTLDDARRAAKARSGECLSDEYVNNHSLLTWQCDRGHVWKAPPVTVRNKGSWCAQCAHMNRIYSPKSKAHLHYDDAGKRLGLTEPSKGAAVKSAFRSTANKQV